MATMTTTEKTTTKPERIECPECDPCNPELDEDGRPFDCYRCGNTGWTAADEPETCGSCGEEGDIRRRYSFGIYAGMLCLKCCKTYRDHCGIDQPQGRQSDLDEQIDGDY